MADTLFSSYNESKVVDALTTLANAVQQIADNQSRAVAVAERMADLAARG